MERTGTYRWAWAAGDVVYPHLLDAGVRVARCHDAALVERILRAREGVFDVSVRPAAASMDQPTLFDPPDRAVPSDLDAVLAAVAAQRRRIGDDRALALLTAAESASGLAAVEMGRTGLPWRPDVHREILSAALGPPTPPGTRPRALVELAARIDAAFGFPVNADSVLDVRAAFRRVGFDVPTTRSWVLRQLDHPAVAPLLEYKELARLHSANGWAWLAEWVRDGRFRSEYVPGGVVSGRWASRGGGALQIPRTLRRAVVADPGHAFVVADAAQLEPRILAAMSGDAALQRVSASTDLYTALADDGFSGDRRRAKVAMLGAMYGATTGESGRLLATLRSRYPVAMDLVEAAARRGERGDVVHSVLGRASPPPGAAWSDAIERGSPPDASEEDRRSAERVARDRGRFTRNFVVQASAADWAAVWLSRARQELIDLPVELVFFQHDELVVHAPPNWPKGWRP